MEILTQNSEWLPNVGTLTSKNCDVNLNTKVVISMVQTLYARLKKHGINYIGQFDNIMLDETHIQIFEKVVDQYNYKRLIGFTATPVIQQKEKYMVDGVEFVRNITMKKYYDEIAVGTTVYDLILEGYLVEDKNYELQLPNFDQLKDSNSNPDGYTSQSLTNLYSNTASLKILKEAYLKLGKGKKTLLFNATTKVNPPVVKMFKNMGIDVRSFDSVNSHPKERAETIEWFARTRNAMLVGTNVFTTGFNVPDIEVVIVNRATKSLALWIQMVGRGSRITDKIFKNHFVVVDLGQNIREHGEWSMKRDWEAMFHEEEGKRKLAPDLLSVWECIHCGAYNLSGTIVCIECGMPKEEPPPIRKPDKTGKIVEIKRTIFPKARAILEYTKAKGEGSAFAFKLLDQKILELFIQHDVDKQYYVDRRQAFFGRIRTIYLPIYFAIIKSDLSGKNRRIETQLNSLYEKIDKHYGT